MLSDDNNNNAFTSSFVGKKGNMGILAQIAFASSL